MSDTENVTIALPPRDVLLVGPDGLTRWTPVLSGVRVVQVPGLCRSLTISDPDGSCKSIVLTDVEAAHLGRLLLAPPVAAPEAAP